MKNCLWRNGPGYSSRMGSIVAEVKVNEMSIIDTVFEAYNKTPGLHYAGVTIESTGKL